MKQNESKDRINVETIEFGNIEISIDDDVLEIYSWFLSLAKSCWKKHERERDFDCYLCTKSYSTKGNLKIHLSTQHKDSLKKF